MSQFININSIHTNLDLGSHPLTKFINCRIENCSKLTSYYLAKINPAKLGISAIALAEKHLQ